MLKLLGFLRDLLHIICVFILYCVPLLLLKLIYEWKWFKKYIYKYVRDIIKCEIVAWFARYLWQIVASIGRVANLGFAYISNKHLSILFGAMLAVVCVSASLHYHLFNNENTGNSENNNENNNENYNNKEDNVNFVIFENENLQWVLDKMFSYDKMREEIVGYIGNNTKSGTGKNDKSSAANNAESGTERNDILSLKKSKAILAFVLFLFTWFVGGGVLVSALIATTIEIWNGKWRLWGGLLRNHTVILGWDETVPILLKDHIESHRFLFFNRPETIVIMTEYPAPKVRLALRDILCKSILRRILRWPFLTISTVVCNGKFDDEEEIRNLCLQRANSIYVVGERNDASHDVRVLMTPAKLQKYSDSLSQRKWLQFFKSRLNCHLNIRNFHVFLQHIKGGAKKGENQICLRPLNIVSHNFYDSWVKRLFSRVPIDKKGKDKDKKSVDLHFAFQKNGDGDIHLVIVGFGSFGQALAVEAATVAHYGKERRTYITVIDDDIGEKERDFRALFPRIDEITDVHLSFITDVKIGSEKFRRLLEEFARNEKKEGEVKGKNQQLTVALTLEDDEACLKQVLPVYRSIDGDSENTQLIVSQQTCETDLDQKEETFNGMYGCKNVKFFGFSNGTGFDVWRREEIARELAKKFAEVFLKKSGEELDKYWWNLKEWEKQYFRMMIDGLEEFCYVRNLGEKGNDKGGSDIDNKTFKRIDLAVSRLLDVDDGFFQGEGVVKAMIQYLKDFEKKSVRKIIKIKKGFKRCLKK